MSSELLKYFLVPSISLAVVVVLTPMLRTLFRALGIMDLPNLRRIHSHPVPRGGGVGVFLGFHIACAFLYLAPYALELRGDLNSAWWSRALVGSALILILGLIDDVWEIRWSTKLTGQLVVAGLMYALGVRFGSLLGQDLAPILDLLLTVGWIVGFINAFNLIDGMDGLCAGLACIAAFGLAMLSVVRGAPLETLVFLSLAGASLGFLRFNFHPASIFLGDAGSMFLGFMLAIIALASSNKTTTFASIGIPLLAIGVPVFDTMLAVWRRSIRSVLRSEGLSGIGSIAKADADHLHHRLLKGGLTQRKAALVLYGVNFTLVAVGLLSVVYRSHAFGILVVALIGGSYVVVRHLASIELWDSGSAMLRGINRPKSQVIVLVLYPIVDLLLMALALAVSRWLAYSHSSFGALKLDLVQSASVWIGIPFISLWVSGTYGRVWSRARVADFFRLGLTIISAVVLVFGLISMIHATLTLADTICALLYLGLATGMVCGLRALPRTVEDLMDIFDIERLDRSGAVTRSVVYGAGSRGVLFLKYRSLNLTPNGKKREDKIVGLIDDDVYLRNRTVHGFRIIGRGDELPKLFAEYAFSEIFITCDLDPDRREDVLKFARQNRISVRQWGITECALMDSDQESHGMTHQSQLGTKERGTGRVQSG